MLLIALNLLLIACNERGAERSLALTPTPVTPTPMPAVPPSPTPPTTLTDAGRIQLGQSLYADHCVACHQLNGEGNLGRFPALNHNPFVTAGQSTAVVDVVLHGRKEMPGFGETLTDLEIAAVTSYIRTAWDNQAPAVSVEKVQEVRQLASFD
jgi:mono/diheme cytochrome c family protein